MKHIVNATLIFILALCGVVTASAQITASGTEYVGQLNTVSVAYVYIFRAGTHGYGTQSVSLQANVSGAHSDPNGNYYVNTDSSGAFTLTFTCSAQDQLYIYAVGGHVSTSNNGVVGEMLALGTCPTSSISGLVMNEITTVAAAYAMAGFATDATDVSSDGNIAGHSLAITGVANAFLNASNLATTSGTALSTPIGGVGKVPQSMIYSLADILNSCNEYSSGTSGPCGTLLGITGALDTASAAIYIAHNPTSNVSTLFDLIVPTPPWPAMSLPPNDFTVGISFTSTASCSCTPGTVQGIAVDNEGYVWLTNYYNNTGTSTLVGEMSPTGSYTSYGSGTGLVEPVGIAVDRAWDAVFIADEGGNQVVQLSDSTGSFVNAYAGGASTLYPNSDINNPSGITLDADDDLWVTNTGSASVSELTRSYGGGIADGSNYSSSTYLTGAAGIAGDSSGYVWATSNEYLSLVDGGTLYPTTIVTSGGGGLYADAIDNSGNIWISNANNNNVFEVNSSGTVISPTGGYTGGGLSSPTGVAIDGNGNVWLANSGSNSVTELTNSGTAVSNSSGFKGAGLVTAPRVIAVDGSGDVWVAGVGVTEIIGAATPVVTPLAYGMFHGLLGYLP
jgi:streptogramin lyase